MNPIIIPKLMREKEIRTRFEDTDVEMPYVIPELPRPLGFCGGIKQPMDYLPKRFLGIYRLRSREIRTVIQSPEAPFGDLSALVHFCVTTGSLSEIVYDGCKYLRAHIQQEVRPHFMDRNSAVRASVVKSYDAVGERLPPHPVSITITKLNTKPALYAEIPERVQWSLAPDIYSNLHDYDAMEQ